MPHSLATLSLNYSAENGKTVLRHVHSGPLRVLKSLYPEGSRICHNILIHPPSGLVGGDVLDIQIALDEGAHALITTPGAARFFASKAHSALQKTRATLKNHARLEWLPMETLAYSGCLGSNETCFELGQESMLLAWDIVSLGLPHAKMPFLEGRFSQHLEIKDVLLEKGTVNAEDHRLLKSPVGLNGKSCLATMVLACGTPFPKALRDKVVDMAREICDAQSHAIKIGISAPSEKAVVVRSLSDQVEPCMKVFQMIRSAWRSEVWKTSTDSPRIWQT